MATRQCLHLLAAVVLAFFVATSAESWLYDHFTTDGSVRVDYDASGQQVASLVLDQISSAGINSKQKYLYGEFSMQMKLIPGNSAGTVTSFYLSSGEGDGHDEIDMEFMGNSSGAPVVLNTNVWANGDGKKEHQFYLWFDPTVDYHTYTIIWNDKNIIFKVDNSVIRCFKRYADLPYPNSKLMTVHATLWDGSYWATEKGKVPIDWSNAPFVVSYRGYSADTCTSNSVGWPLSCQAGTDRWMKRQLNDTEWAIVAWAKKNYMHYNYCEDGLRFTQGFPAECSRN